MENLVSRLRNSLRRFKSSITMYKGHLAAGDKFVTLEESFLSKFDEIVVIGDIHGCYDEFKELLKKVHQESPSKNPDKCLKILVGDLVNKGPKNAKVLEYCRDIYPNSLLAVRGNHDEIVLWQYSRYKKGDKLKPKNEWIEKVPGRYMEYLERLPYTISLPSLGCIIVHAGLDPSCEEPARNTPTQLMTTMRNIVVERNPNSKDTYYRCTKSKDEGAAWALFWPGPEHVYFGHDARRRLQDDHEFATGLDTGCVYGGRLSYVYIKGPRKGEICSVPAQEVYEPTSDTDANIKEKNSN